MDPDIIKNSISKINTLLERRTWDQFPLMIVDTSEEEVTSLVKYLRCLAEEFSKVGWVARFFTNASTENFEFGIVIDFKPELRKALQKARKEVREKVQKAKQTL